MRAIYGSLAFMISSVAFAAGVGAQLVAPQAESASSAPAEAIGQAAPNRHWGEGEGRTFPNRLSYANDYGTLGILLTGAPVDTRNHPFFQPHGPDGRACITCHQPSDAMSLSLNTIRARWEQAGSKDPLFATIDGADCPNLPRDQRASHTMLLDHGLFRISRSWPPKDEYGQTITPEFSIDVVSDPTGCNASPVYGLKSAHPTISVYRRPRMAANLRYVVDIRKDLVFGLFSVKTGMPKAKDPESGLRTNMNLMFDGRELNLNRQALAAERDHLQAQGVFRRADLAKIVDFESRIYAAQRATPLTGDLDADHVPKGLGPLRLSTARASEAGDRLNTPTFQLFDEWKTPAVVGGAGRDAQFRASVARGADLFMTKTFWIRDVWGITNGGSGNPMRRSCSTCHNSQMTGLDNSPGWFDVGMSNWPHSGRIDYMPLFKVTCRADVVQHPYLGRVIYTSDPGRALVSGKCADVGALTAQQSRGLAARAPYFSNGHAKTLGEVLDFYERRFGFSYTPQERQDMINFLGVL